MKAIRSMVLVSSDPGSIAKGSQEIYDRFQAEMKTFNIDDEITLSMVGDIGRKDVSPLVIVYPEAVVYGPLSVDDVPYIVEEHLYKGRIATKYQAPANELTGKIAWVSSRKGSLPAENRIVLRRVGIIDPGDIDEFIIHDGYSALGKVLGEMSPAEVISVIEKSGLRGRGGAGFPTGLKWKFVSKTASDKKYVICNADESEPGTFKDRLLLEGDPHNLIEAMAIAAYAVGADEGYIYIRGEYKLAQERLRNAIDQARRYGILGKNILGMNFSFDIHVHSGAGAYICGEETALIESLEGKRGEPRTRPPYPTTHGLWEKPTLVNNVETLGNIPPIILNGCRLVSQHWFSRQSGYQGLHNPWKCE